MNSLTVRYLDGDQFAIDIRGHTLLVDQPVDASGQDTAPTPTELFLAVASHCTVHNSLTQPPQIETVLGRPAAV